MNGSVEPRMRGAAAAYDLERGPVGPNEKRDTKTRFFHVPEFSKITPVELFSL